MSPIIGMSDRKRLPRLGKIRLGIKVQKAGKEPYPSATDYFVVPPELADQLGQPQPKELEIMFPVEDPEIFAEQWYRAYSFTQGLVCIGDGERCRRKKDTKTGVIASHKTEQWEWVDNLTCNPQECPEFMNKRCRKVMNLQFLMPNLPGLGVWQIDTSSFYSISNLNNMVAMLQSLGRVSLIPLTMALGAQEVSPLGDKKKTVHVLQFKSNLTLAEIAKMSLQPAAKALMVPEPDAEQPPEDLFPAQVIAPTRAAGEPIVEEAKGMTFNQFAEECMTRGYNSSADVYHHLDVRNDQALLEKYGSYENALQTLAWKRIEP